MSQGRCYRAVLGFARAVMTESNDPRWFVSRRGGVVALVRLVWRADRRSFCVLAGLTVALGVLPNLVVVSTGWFTGAVGAAVRDGLGSSSGRVVLLALGSLGVLFAANGVLMAFVRWVTEVANTGFSRAFAGELGAACLAPRYVDVLEDPDLADELDALKEFESSGVYLQAIPALRMVTSRRVGGIGAAVILFGLSWWAPLVMVAGWVAARWGSSRWVRRGFDAARVEGAGQLRRAEYLREFATSPSTAKELRVFGLGSWLTDRYVSTWREAMSRVWSARRASSRDLVVGIAALLVAHAVVFGWLGWQAHRGQVGIGAAVTFGMAVLGTADLGFLGDQEWRLARAGQLAQQLDAITTRLTGTDEPESEPRLREPAPLAGARSATDPVGSTEFAPTNRPRAVGVSVTGVHFGYRGRGSSVLNGFDLEVPAGQSLAIVGDNGAGKSTLLKLLCGLYRPDSGVIRLDGTDVSGMSAAELASHVGIIFQDFLRYELSLRDNVGFGDVKLLHQEAELAGALHDAGGDGVASRLTQGWDTVLARGYPGGVDLSGGEWQRVALTRALVAVRGGAGLLVLDEPTASLDVRAEAELFDRFLDVTRGVTTILVSHRLSGVRRADRIVVVAQGQIVEDGSHDELMTRDGRYASMFRLQAERFVVVADPAASATHEPGTPDA